MNVREESKEGIKSRGRVMGSKVTARYARMRRCLILRQGSSPLRPRPPFPGDLIIRKRGNLSRVRFAGRLTAPPLTDSLCFRRDQLR
jgi:hypothetical protein